MMHTNSREPEQETADTYGRLEGCFVDHHRGSFFFKHCIKDLKAISEQADEHGLIGQHGLRTASLPDPVIDLNIDVMEDDTNAEHLLGCTLQSPVQPDFCEDSAYLLRDLRLPLEPILLASDPAHDLEAHLLQMANSRSTDISHQWLPLSPVKNEKDEGLIFPSRVDRWHLLLLRELDLETISVSQDAIEFREKQKQEFSSAPYTLQFDKQPSRARAFAAISPPLSPVSDDLEAFIPDAEVCQVNLTSDPPSPVLSGVTRLQNCLGEGFESGFSSCPSHPSSPLPNFLTMPCADSHSLKFEPPIILSSSDESREAPSVMRHTMLKGVQGYENISDTDLLLTENFFEDALALTIEAHYSPVNMMVEQERFDPADSIARVPVPLLDFSITPTPWADVHFPNAEAAFQWLRSQTTSIFILQTATQAGTPESHLKWVPYPRGQGSVSVAEDFELLSEAGQHVQLFDQAIPLSSKSFVTHPSDLAILRYREEDELEDIVSEDETFPPPTTQRQSDFANPQEGIVTSPPVELSTGKRKQAFASSFSVLPLIQDPGKTSKLISGFMHLRASKKPRIVSKYFGSEMHDGTSSSSDRNCSLSFVANEPASGEVATHLAPALAPELKLPSAKATFMVSLNLGRVILAHLESTWPRELLIDRDFAQHDTLGWSPGSTQRKQMMSPLSFEADVSLTPSIGVLVTTLLKAKQRSLPGSDTLPPLRERVVRVSRKYEKLLVLVSEASPVDKTAGTPSDSDIAAYAEFVRFAISLQSGVTTFFAHGAEAIVANWILFLMCQYSPHALSLQRFLSATENTWEVFLRRAGMNVFAAQALAGVVLEEFGAPGLAQFLTMTQQERLSKYSQLLGGEKLLIRISDVLDQSWS